MSTKQLFFYATKLDLEEIFQNHLDLKFTKAGVLKSKYFEEYDSFFLIPNYGNATTGDWNFNDDFLVCFKIHPVISRTIRMNNGEEKVSVDLLENVNCVSLKLGGMFGEHSLIASKIAVMSNLEESKKLFSLLEKMIKKKFKKVKSFYVGKNAEILLNKGFRLTTNVKSSIEYDLKK